MQDKFYVLMSDIFYNLEEKGGDGYLILKFSVPMHQLYLLYQKLEVSEIPPIETIDETLKLKYWNIAKTFYEDESTAVKASKAAYVLALITSN